MNAMAAPQPQANGGALGAPQRDDMDLGCCEDISRYRMEHFKLNIVQ
jgi:hypothetical protein